MPDLTCLYRRATTLTCLCVLPFSAQTKEPDDTAFLLDDVVVTATRNARQATTLPANVTVITAEEIRNTTALDVADVLRHVAGVEVQDITGARGPTTQVDMRGFGETGKTNTLVMVDGRRLNRPTLAGVDWTTIPLERVERIEVIRGASAAIYGDHATGGVINIITRSGSGTEDMQQLIADTRIGSYETFKQSMDASGITKGLAYSLNSSYLETDGYRDKSDYRNRTTGIRLQFDTAARLSLDVSAGYKDDEFTAPGSVALNADRRSAGFVQDYDTESSYLHVTPQLQLSDHTRLSVGMGYEQLHTAVSDAFGYEESRTVHTEIRPRLTTSFGGHYLSLGADLLEGKYNVMETGVLFPQKSGRRRESAAYITDSLSVMDDRLFLDAGYRRARIKYEVDGLDNKYVDAEAANLGATYKFAAASKVFLSFQRAYRSFVVDEAILVSRPDLPPQVSDTVQYGVQHAVSRHLTVKATLFRIETDDEIFFDPATFTNTSYEETRRTGLELELQSRLSDSLTAGVALTWLEAELRGDDYLGNDVPGVAERSGSCFATWKPAGSAWTVDCRARWAADRTLISDWANAADWSGDYVVVDVKASYAVTDAITVYAGINNLFAEEYSEFATVWGHYPSPEREFVSGVRIKFDW
jgi:iron complex outermembrane receptor protein